ncbi:uncharacterized protein LOC127249731 [Andrographis paniculata]|uniref:uncharacterized protein LOC127249731 n=1 Tax=Andrographis paniculata TaxID=175694 RepID=UPI0021E97A06|nr:uncharacterized protein LOC127249731 [Andrographis paniculata]
MQILISRKPVIGFSPQFLQPNFVPWKNLAFLRIYPQKPRRGATLTLCSSAPPSSLSYGGWDDNLLIADSGESNRFHNVMDSLGIGDRKYAFVYLFGFVCALAISRVRVSSIIVFPACAIVFALGFSVGLARGGQLTDSRLNSNRKKYPYDNLIGCIEKLKNLGDNLEEYNAKVLHLKNDINRGIECNQVTVTDLQSYIDVIESANTNFQNTIAAVESCVQSMTIGSHGKEGSSDKESGQRRKKLGESGFNFSQYFGALFRSAKPKKMTSIDAEADDRKRGNIIAPSVQEKKDQTTLAHGGHLGNRDPVITRSRAENFSGGNAIESEVVEDEGRNTVEMDDTDGEVLDQTILNYWKKGSRISRDKRVHLNDYLDEVETRAYQSDSYSSVDFSITMNRVKTEASYGHNRRPEFLNRNYAFLDNVEDDLQEFGPEKRSPYAARQNGQENGFGSSPSSILDNDIEFSRCLVEAKNLFEEAKGYSTRRVDDANAEHALNKSAVLLSKAIDMRPMSLLAVGQLGNTYLLHGELKLRKSRQLRSRLVRVDSMSVDGVGRTRNRIDHSLSNKDKIVSTLMNVCEECEELLIKAGRSYRMALSIDGNDIQALYNWGLALSFRGQLISDIGPTAARDADKVFMAAIDKFDAIMSKSNDYAPDALFRWGAALQHRSRLRPGRSQEKVKLLHQARQLYEDALYMDTGNTELQKALSSCVSELEYWHR